MAVINSNNTIEFISSKELFATLRADLQAYDEMGVINTQKFYRHIRYILTRLGLAVYKEYNAIVDIQSSTGDLPENFSLLHAAYRMTPNHVNSNLNAELGKFTYWIEETRSTVEEDNCFNIPAVIKPQCKIEYKTFVRGNEINYSWENPQLMRLASRTDRSLYDNSCVNVGASSINEFNIDIAIQKIYTNFQEGSIFLQYYGLALDENGLPQIPNHPIYYDAIYNHIRYKFFEELFFNGNVQDIAQKYQKAEIDAKLSFREATYFSKLPTFNESINMIRTNRNKFAPYQIE